MFKIGDKVIVRPNWSTVPQTHPGYNHLASIANKIGEVTSLEHRRPCEGASYYVKGYDVMLMTGEHVIVSHHHLIKIDDDDATPYVKTEWKVNDVWQPKKDYKKVLTS